MSVTPVTSPEPRLSIRGTPEISGRDGAQSLETLGRVAKIGPAQGQLLAPWILVLPCCFSTPT